MLRKQAYFVGDSSQAQNDNEGISIPFNQKNRLVGGGFWFMLWLLVLMPNKLLLWLL